MDGRFASVEAAFGDDFERQLRLVQAYSLMDENDPAALRFEAKIHSAQFAERVCNRFVPIWRSVKHQESPAPAPSNLPPVAPASRAF